MLVNFTKMHGLGNDFVVLDLISRPVKLLPQHIIKIADRHLGIGCDQVLLIEPPLHPASDFFFRAFNANGQEAEQCGNGLRCAARYLVDSGIIKKNNLIADSLSGSISITIKGQNLVEINLGPPRSPITKLSLASLVEPIILAELFSKPLSDTWLYAISMGNPHGICFVNALEKVNVNKHGKILSTLPIFSQQANISFAHVLNSGEINLAVYERGVGATLACGTAACATVATASHLKYTSNQVKVNFSCGHVTATIDDISNSILLLGPTAATFNGTFYCAY